MNEKEEIRIKKSLLVFIQRNIQFTGTPEFIEFRRMEMVSDLFDLFVNLTKKE